MAQLIEENIGGVAVLHISGSLGVTGLSAIEARFNALAAGKAVRVVADIGEVNALTTPAISLILRTAQAVEKRGGMMVFAAARPSIYRVFTCCRLDILLNFAGDVGTAILMVRFGTIKTGTPFNAEIELRPPASL